MSRDLRPVYTAPSEAAARERFAEFDAKWGKTYPAISKLWENAWSEFIPFLDYDVEIRRVICSTDEKVKVLSPWTWSCGRVRLLCGRGRPPSEVQGLGLCPAAQRVPSGDLIVAPRWRRPRPPSFAGALACQSATSR